MADTKPLSLRMPRAQKEMLACLQCGYCIEVCEAHGQTPWESVTPRGKIYYLTQLDKRNLLDWPLNRDVKVSDDFVKAMYKCTGCGNCETVCHANLELVALWEKVRTWFVDSAAGPMKVHWKMLDNIVEKHNPYGEDQNERAAWWPKDVKREKTPDVIVFAGCTGSYRMKQIPQAGVQILDRAGVKQNCLGPDEYCCTSPALRVGVTRQTMKFAEKMVSKADAMGAKDMVMTCSGCFKTVSTDFGNYYSKTGQKVYHFVQYVENLLAAKKLTLNNPINAKVTYHDPCHLGRHSGVYDAPRNILKKIKGLKYIEMEKNRDNSRCCGAGGGYKSAFNEWAVNVAAERIRDAEAVGAEIIATACPFCVLNLRDGAKKIGSKVKVMDISEMLLTVTAPLAEPPAAPAAAAAPAPVPVAVPVAAAPIAVPVPAPVAAVPLPAPAPAVTRVVITEEGADDDVFGDVLWEDDPEVKVRKILWKRGYRYRRRYGKKKINIAFLTPKVAAFVTGEPNDELDSSLRNVGWTVLRFKETDVTDGKKEAEEIIAAISRNLDAMEKEEAAADVDEKDDDVSKDESADDSAELKLRRRLWKGGYRYRRHYGREMINIAFRKAKVAVFVGSLAKDEYIDDPLRSAGWIVLRYIEDKVTDAKKEYEEVVRALDKNIKALGVREETVAKPEPAPAVRPVAAVYEETDRRSAADEETDDEVLRPESATDSAELKLRRRLWHRGYRYRRHYGREKIGIAFPKARVAAFVGPETVKDMDASLKSAGWTVLRFKEENVRDAKKESEKVMAAVDRSLSALMNEDVSPKSKFAADEDLFGEEKDDDPADLKMRRILWREGYRYRRRYGREKMTVAFRRAKVGAFVCSDTRRRKGDDLLVKRGWTIMRFKDANMTDARKEADKVMAAVDRNLELLSQGVIPEGANITSTDVLDAEVEENTPEYRLRMALWKDSRYRRNYGEYRINIAYPSAKVAVFVDPAGARQPCDGKLEEDGWLVLRFKGANITDGKKEAEKVLSSIEKNIEFLEELAAAEDADEEDLSYLLEDTPEGRVRRAVWNKRLRYRRNYNANRIRIDVAFVRFRVAVYIDEDGKDKPSDETLRKRGWNVIRIKRSNITDGKKEAEVIHAAVKESKKALRKKKRRTAKKKE